MGGKFGCVFEHIITGSFHADRFGPIRDAGGMRAGRGRGDYIILLSVQITKERKKQTTKKSPLGCSAVY